MAKQYVDFNSSEYFDAETSLDDKDIKLTPKNDRALDFVGEITINGVTPGSGGDQVQADWAQTDSAEVDYIKNKPTIPTKTSDLTNDGNGGSPADPFITKSANDLTNYTKTSDLATVATTGDYTDLSNTPTIPDAVSVTQVQSTGTKIATITVGSTGTDIYAPAGGGGLQNLKDIESGFGFANLTISSTVGDNVVALCQSSAALQIGGKNTVIEGEGNKVWKNTSDCANNHLEGAGNSIGSTVDTVSACHIEGTGNIVNTFRGDCITTHIEGISNTIGGGNNDDVCYGHVEGRGNILRSRTQHVFGEYNVMDPNPTVGTSATRNNASLVEIVGNGTADNARSNARTLDWSGNEMLAGNLTLGGASGVKLRSNNAALETSSDGGTTWNPVGGGSAGTDYVQPSSVGSTITLDSDKFYDLGTLTGDLTISFNAAATGKLSNYQGQFTYDGTGSPVPTITFPNTVTWKVAPSYLDGKTYQFSIVNGMGVIIEF